MGFARVLLVAPASTAAFAACTITGFSVAPNAPATLPTSAQIGDVSPDAMRHVLTADYLGGSDGTHAIPWSKAAPYLTWAETDWEDASAIHRAGIKTMDYLAPNRIEPGNPLYTDDEKAFAHTCGGARIYDQWDELLEWVTAPASSSMRGIFSRYVKWLKSEATFDAIFEDEAGALTAYEQYDPFKPTFPCRYSNERWLRDEIGLNQAPSLPILFNGLNELNGDDPSLSIRLLAGSNTIGGNYEGCYNDAWDPKENGWLWRDVENTELRVVRRRKLFECMLRSTTPAADAIGVRIYAYASFLLTYDRYTSIYWTYFKTPSGLHVMPETQLVATSPLRPAPPMIGTLRLPSGAFVRQYRHCYVTGREVGPCAAVVNPDTGTSYPFPPELKEKYHHTLVLRGAGVLDGGTISIEGPAPPARIGAVEALIVFR
jgi:hypothetical protein